MKRPLQSLLQERLNQLVEVGIIPTTDIKPRQMSIQVRQAYMYLLANGYPSLRTKDIAHIMGVSAPAVSYSIKKVSHWDASRKEIDRIRYGLIKRILNSDENDDANGIPSPFVFHPDMAAEAYKMLSEGKTIEIENDFVFGLMRYAEKIEGNIDFLVQVNKLNKGYTLIKRKV